MNNLFSLRKDCRGFTTRRRMSRLTCHHNLSLKRGVHWLTACTISSAIRTRAASKQLPRQTSSFRPHPLSTIPTSTSLPSTTLPACLCSILTSSYPSHRVSTFLFLRLSNDTTTSVQVSFVSIQRVAYIHFSFPSREIQEKGGKNIEFVRGEVHEQARAYRQLLDLCEGFLNFSFSV